MTHRIAFIDTSLVDYQSLVAALHPSIKVVLISPMQDGWQQIANALARHSKLDASGIDAIDIISHGAAGSVMLGSGVLNASTLPTYAATLAEIGRYLTADADILLYGCDVGAGSAGTALLDQLAAITGVNIAASTDVTGAAAMGGNWQLEASAGLINTAALQMPAYSGILALFNEFQVNSTTLGDQWLPSITGLTDGGYVVSWMSFGQDGSGYGIYAQRYNASGTALGVEVRVNTTTLNDQQQPSITALTNGGYVISWMSLDQDGSGEGIYAQRYNASGTALGAEVRVNTTTLNDQQRPSITGLTDGGYVVSWSSLGQDGSDLGIYSQRYTASGAVMGGEVQVNTTTLFSQGRPSITALTDGGYVVSWTSFQDGISFFDIYAQRYTASGAANGGQVQVNTTTFESQLDPVITALSDGGYVVSWTSFGQDGSGYGIYAQRYDAGGSALGIEVRVNTSTLNNQWFHSITGLTNGGYVVSWTSFELDGISNGSGIYAQRYNANGTALGVEVLVSTTLNFQAYPSITGLTDGGYVVSWSSFGQDGSGYGIYAQRYDAGGNRVSMTLQGDAGDNNLVWTGSGPVIIDGAAGNDIITGGADDDILNGGAGNDNLNGRDGNDQLNGGAGNDQLVGGAGNDELNGGAGSDTMYGGLGDDTYVVNVAGDVIIENVSSGQDTVRSSISYTLGANLEDLILTGTADNNGTGNALDNVLTGNGGDNTLAGDAGNDQLFGQGGDDALNGGLGDDILNGGSGRDTLIGGVGDDMLNGGTGRDTLIGGVGNDIYVIDDTDDIATELSAQGLDTVQSRLGSYTLVANIENLVLLGAARTGTGNGLNNMITGTGLHNVLRGGAGNDQLFGLGGNDILTGGTGNDQFVFSTTPAAGNVDRVTDFIAGQDQLVLDALVFTGLNLHNQALSATMFRSGAGITTAADANDHVIYNTTNGALFYDADGAGGTAAVQFATILGVPTLDPASILIMN